MNAVLPERRCTNLLDYERARLEDYFVQCGEKPFRARQIFRRLYRDGGIDDDLTTALSDLPAARRESLRTQMVVQEPPLVADIPAADGVRKLLFDIGANERVEAVIIPEARRTTLCVSSQAGCALACRFCLTGKQGFSRNLSTAQIVAQLRIANRLLAADGNPPITNVVMMGMGEPLLNAEAVFPAVRIFTDAFGFALSPRRVTVSTAGIVPAMARLRESCRVALAVSLHAPTDSLRDSLMPINRKYPLAMLMDACRRHIAAQPRAYVTLEYVMLDGVNDDDACGRALIRLVHGLRCKVNLIPFNPFPDTEFRTTPMAKIMAFRANLMRRGVMTTVRRTRGDEVLAACGQLAGGVRARTRGLAREAPLVRAE